MKLTARDLKDLDVIDDIIPEPLGGAHRNPAEAASNLERYIVRTLRELKRVADGPPAQAPLRTLAPHGQGAAPGASGGLEYPPDVGASDQKAARGFPHRAAMRAPFR